MAKTQNLGLEITPQNTSKKFIEYRNEMSGEENSNMTIIDEFAGKLKGGTQKQIIRKINDTDYEYEFVSPDSSAVEGSDLPITSGGVFNEKQSILGMSGEVTLNASSWVSNEQSITLTNLGENDCVFFYPFSITDKTLCEAADIFTSTNSSIVIFSVINTPSENIKLSYFIVRGKSNE